MLKCQMQGNKAACNSSGSRAAIRLQNVTVDPDLTLAEAFHIRHCPQAATDQTLDFLGASSR